MKQRTDAELAVAASRGSASAYGELVSRWGASIHAVCRARVRQRETAADLAHETFLRGWRAIDRLEDPARFAPWLRGIAVRACLDWLKAKERTQVFAGELGDGFEFAGQGRSPAASAEHEDDLAHLREAVERLPEEMKETLMLFYFDRLDYRSIAALTGVSIATVNARLTRARADLRHRMLGDRSVEDAAARRSS